MPLNFPPMPNPTKVRYRYTRVSHWFIVRSVHSRVFGEVGENCYRVVFFQGSNWLLVFLIYMHAQTSFQKTTILNKVSNVADVRGFFYIHNVWKIQLKTNEISELALWGYAIHITENLTVCGTNLGEFTPLVDFASFDVPQISPKDKWYLPEEL